MSVSYKIEKSGPCFHQVAKGMAQLSDVSAAVRGGYSQSNEHITVMPRRSALIEQLQELGRERNKLNLEKAELENTLEAEQEFIANRLQMQVLRACHSFVMTCWLQQCRRALLMVHYKTKLLSLPCSALLGRPAGGAPCS